MNTDSQEIRLSTDELRTLHWLAANGFRRLLLLGEKGSLGFQSEEEAEKAHWALDHLEHYLPRKEIADASVHRIGAIMSRWPKSKISKPHGQHEDGQPGR